MIRVGLGKDVHRLVPGRPFLVGGIEIPSERGELGHSDGDVLAHAVTDALLGAAGLGDIGELFPPTDERWKDAHSMELLKTAWDIIQKEGWRILNIDGVITCEKPKILPYRDAIRHSLATVLGVPVNSVFIKGKTNEKLDAIGAGDAVEALVVCLLEKN
ncbi:MAG: 2-C-methyl-D-erythritol 2,4-cyclodiphosphate synthase [Treponemataceae bacterium]|nr:2-C-methyl-D-erythritol 2,4-cyclodiphosphate synthase [Treponemataceae bacterium]